MNKSNTAKSAFGGLTPSEVRILRKIRQLLARKATYGPSYDEIAEVCGVSKTYVYGVVAKLKKLGWVSYTPGVARSLVLLKEVPGRAA